MSDPSKTADPFSTGATRFPESTDEKAARLSAIVGKMAASGSNLENAGSTLPSVDALERRIGARLASADVKDEEPNQLKTALARQLAKNGHAVATQLARGEVRFHDLDTSKLANVEAVIRVAGRPAWYVRKDVPEVGNENDLSRDEEFWIVQIGNAGKELRRVCSRVGVVTLVNDGQPVPFGTAWVIGAHTVITNAHVAKELAHQAPGIAPGDPRGSWRMRPGVKGVVDFAFENGLNRSTKFDIEDVLYVETSQVPDVAVFRLRESGTATPPPIILDLNNRADWRDTNVFAAGHPIRDQQNDPHVDMVFGPLDGTKRFSPGKLIAALGGTVLAHDCSTTNGSSGSPIVDFASLRAVGLHYFGAPGARNESVLLAAYANHPAIVKSLSETWA
jgi:glutamyl endopeptidase